MRFDAKRAIADAIALDFPRSAGSDEERRAAAIVAEKLRSAGLEVEIAEFEGRMLPDLFEPIASAGLYSIVMIVVASTLIAGRPDATSSSLYLLVFFFIIFILKRYLLYIFGVRAKAPVVIGSPRGKRAIRDDGDRSTRGVFLASLGRVAGYLSFFRFAAYPTIAILIACLAFRLGFRNRPFAARIALFTIAASAIVSTAVACSVKTYIYLKNPGLRDQTNATGLATLVELARNSIDPKSRLVDFVFVACGNYRGNRTSALDHVLKKLLKNQNASLLFMIDLEAPGFGPEWSLVSAGVENLAERAAADLRIPIQSAIHIDSEKLFGHSFLDFVRITGGEGKESAETSIVNRDAPLEAGRLAAAAQLAVEIALRYDKLHSRRSSRTETGGASAQPVAAKSDQNRG